MAEWLWRVAQANFTCFDPALQTGLSLLISKDAWVRIVGVIYVFSHELNIDLEFSHSSHL